MRNIVFLLMFISSSLYAQVHDSIAFTAQDTSVVYSMYLPEVVVTKEDIALQKEREKLLILKRRVYRTYPYAKITADKLVQINATMAKLKTNKEKKKYLKIVESYLQEEFEPKLKKMSRKDGQILVKLISRQTGNSTFDLIKDYKSGWKAFWSNNTAKLFDINLKEEYKPFNRVEDFYIESILISGFQEGLLVEQKPAKPFDLKELAAHWRAKVEKSKEERKQKTED